jgi:hypothetical protein
VTKPWIELSHGTLKDMACLWDSDQLPRQIAWNDTPDGNRHGRQEIPATTEIYYDNKIDRNEKHGNDISKVVRVS